MQSVAVGFLHSFVNPVHERRARDILAEAMPEVPVSLSSDVSPEMREWERFSTTVANAYVQPLMARYLRRLEAELHATGPDRAGVPDAVGRRTDHDRDRVPLSDPPGGKRPRRWRDLLRLSARGSAAWIGVLSFDMGGTTAKICLIDDGTPADRAHVRGRAGRAVPQRLGPAAAHSGDRDGGDRRRRRLARACRCDGAHRRRAGKRRRRSRARPATAAAATSRR